MRNCSPWPTACLGSPHNALHSSSYWASVSKPHTSELNRDFSSNIIGASAASPTLVVKTENCLYIYLYIYIIYIWYVRIPYMHSALFVRDAIFPHNLHIGFMYYCLLKRQD